MHLVVVVKATQSCPTLCDPMDCSPSGSSIHGILQARILEWNAIPFSRGSSLLRDRTQLSCTVGRFFTIWANRKALTCTQPCSEQWKTQLEKQQADPSYCEAYGPVTMWEGFFLNFIYFIFWLWWVFAAACWFSLVGVSRNYSLLQCAGFSLSCWGSQALGMQASVIPEHRLSTYSTWG